MHLKFYAIYFKSCSTFIEKIPPPTRGKKQTYKMLKLKRVHAFTFIEEKIINKSFRY